MTATIPARPPLVELVSPVEFARWLLRWALDALVALVTHPAAGKHAERWHEGAGDESIAELRAIVDQTDTKEIPVVAEDVTGTGFEPVRGVLDAEITRLFTDVDRLDADRTFPATLKAAGEWPDPVDVAFAAGQRNGGA